MRSRGSIPDRKARSPAAASSSGPSAIKGLLRLLGEARDLGFLGPGPVEEHLLHAEAYLAGLPLTSALVVDLGSGGGVPGLPLAIWRPDLTFCLVDSTARRTTFLERAVGELGLSVDVICERAEVLGRDPAWRGKVDVVVARSLAPPAVTAEYVAPLLRTGGYALIAEPPGGSPRRWPADGLADLGMEAGELLRAPKATLQRLNQETECSSRFPRRVGVAARRPLFRTDV